MFVLFLALESGIAIALIHLFATFVVGKWKLTRAAQKGCESAHMVYQRDPWGIMSMLAHFRARRESRWPVLHSEILDKAGENVHTAFEYLPGNSVLMTRDPENLKAMLTNQAGDFVLGESRAANLKALAGTGLLTAEGTAWQHSRAMVRPQFARQQVADMDLLEVHTRHLLQRLVVNSDKWTDTVDLQPLFLNFTIDMITELIFGYSVNTQDPNLRSSLPTLEGVEPPNPASFASSLDIATEWAGLRVMTGKWYWLMQSRKFNRSCKEIRKYVDWFVQLVLSRDKTSQELGNGLATRKFVLLEELSKSTQDAVALREEVLNLFVGGRNTTAALLGWVIYHLSRHPSTYDKLRDTVVNEFGTDGEFDFHKLHSCQYLQYCINESLRLTPVAAAIGRKTKQDTILPRGGGSSGKSPVFVPKNTMVLGSIHALHHRADIWGEDTEVYNPERWHERPLSSNFVPFGGGPRKCIGRKSSCYSSML